MRVPSALLVRVVVLVGGVGLALALAFGAAAVPARTIHVSLQGWPGAPGTKGAPVPTLAEAARIAAPGDTVLVSPGVYTGAQRFRQSGRPGAPITIRPERAGTVTFDGRGTPRDTDLVLLIGDHLRFTGFAVVNSTRSGIAAWETRGVEITGNAVTGSHRAGIWVGANRQGRSAGNRIASNRVFGNCLENTARNWRGGWARGIAVDLSENTEVEGNLVERNHCEGIGALSQHGVTIRRNVVGDNFSCNIYIDNAPGTQIHGNLVFTSGDQDYFRNGKPARGILIANEFTRVMLRSRGIVAQRNILIGVGGVGYADFGARTGLIDSRLTENNVLTSASLPFLLSRIRARIGFVPHDPRRYCGSVIRC